MSITQTYVGLHNHSSGSFLDGFSNVDSMAKRAAKVGMPALGLTDHGDVNQHVAFQRACDANGIQPIFGVEAYVVNGTVQGLREAKSTERSHLCIFAENNTGLSNLWALSTRAYAEGFYYKPLLQWDWIKERSEGLIATDGCMLAYMAKYILDGKDDAIAQLVGRYLNTFGEGNFYMELHTWQFLNPSTPEELELNAKMSKINQGKVKIARRYGLPLIVVNDAHYASPKEWDAHALVWKINTSQDDKTESGQKADWIMTDGQVIEFLGKHGIGRDVALEAIANTAEIAARCTARVEPTGGLPSVTGTPEGDRALFMQEVERGYQEMVIDKGLDDDPRYRIRLSEEVELILAKFFDGYFLIVQDFVKWAKGQGILVGPARGSGAGSLVGYCLKITTIDPVEYDLMFGRFITPGRKELPDYDIDFPQSRRQDVIAYLRAKYGDENVCAIGTLSRMKAAGAMKDLCRAQGVPFADANAMSSLIAKVEPQKAPEGDEESILSYEDLLERVEGVTPWIAKYPNVFNKMEQFVGLIRQSGVHASGILISPKPLMGNLPLRVKKDSGLMVSQFESSEATGFPDVAWMGYTKFDVLGIRHLDSLMEAARMIKERHGVDVDYYSFTSKELDDELAYEPIGRGDTLGIFQTETSLATGVATRMKPENVRDMAVLVSIGRPGVIDAGMLDEYIDRRAGIKEVKTPHPIMTELLEDTYGVVVYQEQVIALVQRLANYSLEEADGVRKIMGKKLVDKMKASKEEFIRRCLANPEFVKGCGTWKPLAIAQKCWDNIEPSAGYSFGKGHAHGYAFIAAWEIWIKHYYPAEYYTAMLRTDTGDAVKTNQYLSDLRKKKYKVLPPDINDSDEHFTLTDEGVRYGITTVAGVGKSAYNEIEAKRPFESLDDVLVRVSKRSFSSAIGTKLITVGALDRFGVREALLHKFFTERKLANEIPDFNNEDWVAEMEKELVGSYITKDPMDRYAGIIEKGCIQTAYELDEAYEGELKMIGGSITRIHEITTKRKDKMCFLTVEWRGEKFEPAMFPQQYNGYKRFLVVGKPVVCQVEKTDRGSYVRDLMRLDKL